MKLRVMLALVLVLTLFAVAYVWQQTEIFRLGYIAQKKLATFNDLLDKNSNLRYNLSKSTSLIRIESKVSENGEFRIPASYMVVKASSPEQKELPYGASVFQKPKQILANVFSVKRQAEAKTISP